MDSNGLSGLLDLPYFAPNATVACNGSTFRRLTEADEMLQLLNPPKRLATRQAALVLMLPPGHRFNLRLGSGASERVRHSVE